MEKEVKLGEVYTDKITGLKGVAIARIEYLNGCVRVELQPKQVKDGKPVESTWVDEQQLKNVKSSKTDGPGGSRNIPSSFHTP